MSLSLLVRKAALAASLLAVPALGWAQTNQAASSISQASATYGALGSEYPLVGLKPGDQVNPRLSLRSTGGYIVWQDNITDGYGWGVSAMRLDSGFSPVQSSFRCNVVTNTDQNNPQVTVLNNGGAAFCWQSGKQGFQHIWGRFLSASNTWLTTNDVKISTATNAWHVTPALTTLTNGNVVATYCGINQVSSNSMQDVYAQILTPTGTKVGGEFLVNQFVAYNQRNPAIAPLADGRFIIVWVSEQERATASAGTNFITYGTSSIDIYGRIFNANGVAATGEFLVNTSSGLCSSPKVAAAADGSFLVVWAEADRLRGPNASDIWARKFSSTAVGGTAFCVNTTRIGDQYAPTVAADGGEYLVAWSSLGQDGDLEGVFGQLLRADGSRDGREFQVNTTWISKQIQPVVASDGKGRFLAAWSSFTSGLNSFDLFAQRLSYTGQALPPMDAPFVYVPFVVSSNVYQPQIQVAWPVQEGFAVDHYEVYVDGALSPTASTTNNVWLMTTANGLTANSTHSFKVAFVTTSQQRSPLSAAATAKTWTGTLNWGGIPSDWMTLYYGSDISKWPQPGLAVSAGGPTLLQVFLTGASPFDATTWLRVKLVSTPQGGFVTWNPQPGFSYQLQSSTDLVNWQNLGASRFAAGTVDSVYVGSANLGYFRIVRLR